MKATPPTGLIIAISIIGIAICAFVLFYALPYVFLGYPADSVQATGADGNNSSTTATTILWLLAVAGGPLLIAIAMVYGIVRRRRLSKGERDAQEESVDRLYDRRQ